MVERTWLFFVLVIYCWWWWELLVLLVLVQLVLLVGRSVLSVELMRRRRRRRLVVLLVVVVAIGLRHAEAAAPTETRSGYRAVPKKESQRKSRNTFAKLKQRCPIVE